MSRDTGHPQRDNTPPRASDRRMTPDERVARSAAAFNGYANERWFEILKAAIADDPRGVTGVAERLNTRGASRVAISLIIGGKYPAVPRGIVLRVMEVYDVHHCPHLGRNVRADYCIEFNRGEVPTWDPGAVEQRRACRVCPSNPMARDKGA